jgi:hypothetical protein
MCPSIRSKGAQFSVPAARANPLRAANVNACRIAAAIWRGLAVTAASKTAVAP